MDWQEFRQTYRAESQEFVRGRPGGVLALYSTDGPMHICGAFGGYEAGAEAVRSRVQWAGEQFTEGTFTEELVCEWVGEDSAITLAVETIDARVAGRAEPVRQVLRVTQAYRRGPEGWKIAHRHADFLRPTSTEVPPIPVPAPRTASEVMRTVTSADGTEIALERVTEGPTDLVLLSGGPSTRTRWAKVAAQLDGAFSCWLMDRRGKGDSGDTAPYSFEREYDDIAAAAASFDHPVVIGGHSSGALCVLGAAQRRVPAAALVLYEPPWPLNGDHTPLETVEKIEALIAEGDRAAALETAFRDLVRMPPPAIEAVRGTPAWMENCSLVHTWPREMREVARAGAWDTARLAAIEVPVLLLDGTLSPPHHRQSTAAVAAALPDATVTELPGQGHGALDTAPDLVAAAILAFGAR